MFANEATNRRAPKHTTESRIALQRAQANVDKMTMKSPIDGIVVMASIAGKGELGQMGRSPASAGTAPK